MTWQELSVRPYVAATHPDMLGAAAAADLTFAFDTRDGSVSATSGFTLQTPTLYLNVVSRVSNTCPAEGNQVKLDVRYNAVGGAGSGGNSSDSATDPAISFAAAGDGLYFCHDAEDVQALRFDVTVVLESLNIPAPVRLQLEHVTFNAKVGCCSRTHSLNPQLEPGLTYGLTALGFTWFQLPKLKYDMG